jgi:hypothetical protein
VHFNQNKTISTNVPTSSRCIPPINLQCTFLDVFNCVCKVLALPHVSLHNHVACAIPPLGATVQFNQNITISTNVPTSSRCIPPINLQCTFLDVFNCVCKVLALPHANFQKQVVCGILPLGGNCAFQPKYNHKHQGANLKQLYYTQIFVNQTLRCHSVCVQGFRLAPCKFEEPCSLWHSTFEATVHFNQNKIISTKVPSSSSCITPKYL